VSLLAHEHFHLPKYIQCAINIVSSVIFVIRSDHATVDNFYDAAHFLLVFLAQLGVLDSRWPLYISSKRINISVM